MPAVEDQLWSLTFGQSQIDPQAVAAAICDSLDGRKLDFRTRLLIRDSLIALEQHWGKDSYRHWLSAVSNADALEKLKSEELGAPGFPTLAKRFMNPTTPLAIEQFLRELGSARPQRLSSGPTRIIMGGSAALILQRCMARATEDIDLVDEIPAALRDRHDLLAGLMERYGLRLAHFQSHYLPDGWEQRLASFGRIGELDVFLVDAVDIIIGKLFSAREKDCDDLRAVVPSIPVEKLEERLRQSGARLGQEPALAENARKNWFILFGKELPGAAGMVR